MKQFPLLDWLSSGVTIQTIGLGNIPQSPAVILVKSDQRFLLRGIYSKLFGNRAGSGSDTLLMLPDNLSSRDVPRQVVQIARTRGESMLPVALAAVPVAAIPLLLSAPLPLPRARVVVVIEPAFQVPEHPQDIPDSWLQALEHQLDRANGRARDALATWKRQSS